VPTAYLIVSIVGLLFTLNAVRPLRVPGRIGAVGDLGEFFAAWLTNELAPYHLLWQVIATVVFIALGALDSWQGWLGLLLSFVSWAGIGLLITRSMKAKGVVEEALREALGVDYRDAIDPRFLEHEGREPKPWRQIVFPFVAVNPSVERVKNISYGPAGKRNRLDVYVPKQRAEGAPVLLQVHGGAWIVGEKEQQGRPLMLHLASRGWVCVAINYRLSPRGTFPDMLIDVKRAIAWTREHIAEYGGDARFLAVTGGSAGGHLTALTALTQNDPEYQPGFEAADTSISVAVPFYGVYDFVDREGYRGKANMAPLLERMVMKVKESDDPDAYAKASPLDRLRADAPPFFVIHGSMDKLVPVREARLFVHNLRAVSHEPVAYAELPGADHAFEIFPSIRTGYVIGGVGRFLAWTYSRAQAVPDRPDSTASR
jgi:acetyl esterase/lipase